LFESLVVAKEAVLFNFFLFFEVWFLRGELSVWWADGIGPTSWTAGWGGH